MCIRCILIERFEWVHHLEMLEVSDPLVHLKIYHSYPQEIDVEDVIGKFISATAPDDKTVRVDYEWVSPDKAEEIVKAAVKEEEALMAARGALPTRPTLPPDLNRLLESGSVVELNSSNAPPELIEALRQLTARLLESEPND